MENKFDLVESYQGNEIQDKLNIEIINRLLNCGSIDGTVHIFIDLCKKTSLGLNDYTFLKEKDDSGIKG